MLGLTTATNGDSSVSQTFTAPNRATSISFWYKMTCPDTVQYEVWAITSTETPGGWGSPRRLDSASSSCGGQPWPNQIIPFVPYSTGSAASGQFYFGDYIGIVPLSLGLGDPWTGKFIAAWSDSRIAPVVRGDLS